MIRRVVLLAIAVALSCAAGLSCGLPRAVPACCHSRHAVVRLLAKKSKPKATRAKAAKTKEVAAALDGSVVAAPEAAEAVAEAVEAPPPPPPPPEGSDPIFPVGGPQLWETHRVAGMAPSYDQIFGALRATKEDAVRDFVNVNRDLLDYRFMYRMTAQVLRMENTGDADGATELRLLRDETLRWAQRFDAALFQAIVAAEGRLGQVLAQYATGGTPSAADCVAAAGAAPLDIFAFWLVVRSAAAAWRRKLGIESVVAIAEQKLAELLGVAEAIEASPAAVAAGALGPLPSLLSLGDLAPPDAAAARAALDAAAPGAEAAARLQLIRRVGCVAAACQRHAFEAYNPMTQQAAGVYDMLLHGEVRPLEAPDIAMPPRETFSSRLVQMAYEADKSLPPEYRQLFW